MIRILGGRGWSVVLCVQLMALAAQASDYGCKGLENLRETPVIEGRNGVFFRIQSDLRMDHRFSDAAIKQLSAFSRSLEEHGTRLVYLPVPTKALAMPQNLPPKAALYGYDDRLAAERFADLIERLENAGVTAVNALPEMRALPKQTPPFFAADFHWTGYGAQATAKSVAARLRSDTAYQALPKSTFVTTETGLTNAFSGLRQLIQKSCHKALPKTETMRFETTLAGEDQGEGVDIFEDTTSTQIVLVGTSFSDSDINNFAGFLSDETGLDVVNHALTGGNQFGAIQDYVTSREFQASRPAILIWENPIYNALTRFSDQPMQELIASARGHCLSPLPVDASDGLSVTLPSGLGPEHVLMADLGMSPARRVTFRFTTKDGRTRNRVVQRSTRQTPSGRFFMPLSGFGESLPHRAQLSISEQDIEKVEVFLCSGITGDKG